MASVWEMRGRNGYWIVAEVYLNAHDEKTYVARIENNCCSPDPGCHVYDIKFYFRARRAAEAWAMAQRAVVCNKIRRARKAAS